MNTFIRKSNKVISYFKTCLKYKDEFNVQIAMISLLGFFFHKDNFIGRKVTAKKHKIIKEYIFQCTSNIQNQYIGKKFDGEKIKNDSVIWTCWWQGIDNAPEMVKLCINSIKQNMGKHKIVIISEQNYDKYIDIPETIIKKFNSGKIGHANFADVLRVALLAKYGGIWLDATIFMTAPFSENIYQVEFCSNKRKNQKISLQFPTECRWGTYFMASGSQNLFFQYINDIFFDFLEKKDMFIDYNMIDYIMATGYDYIPEIKNMVDNSPYWGETIHHLLPIMSKPYDPVVFDQITLGSNIHKLTYKWSFKSKYNGQPTFYQNLIKMY